jgi:hypothetical protein
LSTLETHNDAVVADLPPNPFIDGHSPTRGNLCCLAGAIVTFKAGQCGSDAKATESFVREDA